MPRLTKKKKNPFLIGVAAGSLIPSLVSGKSKSQIPTLGGRPMIEYKRPALQRVSRQGPSPASALQSADSKMVAAPVANGFMMRGANTGFSAAPPINGVTGIRVVGRQIWAQLANGTASGASAALVVLPFSTALAGSSVQGLTFDPDDTKTMPLPLTSLANIFSRYCLRRCRVVYTPSASTSSTVAVAMAVYTDAAFAQTLITAASQSFIGVMENSNAASSPIWGMMSIDVPCDNTLRYSFQSVADGSLTVSEERQDHAFGLVAACDTVLPATATVFGHFHLEYTCDFYELFSGLTENSLLRAENRLLGIRERLSPRQLVLADRLRDARNRRALVAARSDAQRAEEKSPVVTDSEESPVAGWTRLDRKVPAPTRPSLDLEKVQARSVSLKG